MKKVLMLSLAIMMIAGSVVAADDIGIYADQGAQNCTLVPVAFSPFTVYVVHRTTGATGSQFMVTNTSGYTISGSVLGGFLAIGDAFTDLSLAYGGCLGGPAVAAVALSGFGFPVPGQVCGMVTVVAAPGKVGVLTVDCGFAEVPISGGRLVFNGDATCPCVEPNPTEESTWGRVKSLYR